MPSKPNKSSKNSSGAAIKIVNSLSHNVKENTNTNNAQKDHLSLSNTVTVFGGAKSSISKENLPSPPFSSHTRKGKLVPKTTHTNAAALTHTDATRRDKIPTSAICTNAAAATNTGTELIGANLSNAMEIFPSLTHSDSMDKNLSSSTKIGPNALSPPFNAHTQINKANNKNLESRSKFPALDNSDAHYKKANASNSGEIVSPQIRIDEHKQEERPSTTLNAFWSIFNLKPDISKLSLNKKPTNRSGNTGKRSISPHQRSAS